ncbi:MAG: S8 family serine peptidase [Planctomycetota bacterium]|jgi:hypothetical protein
MIPLVSALLFSAFLAPLPQESQVQSMRHGEVVTETWTTQDPREGAQAWYRISLDGGATFGRDRATHYHLQLRYATFDPLRDSAPFVAPHLAAPEEGNELWIVQYIAKGVEPWRTELRALGAVDHRFLGMHANIWQMSAESAAEAARLPFVRWVGPFHPAYKLENELVDAWREGAPMARRYNIVVGEWGPAQKAELVGLIGEIGGTVEQAIDEGWIVSATLDGEQLLQVEDMDIVRSVMGADYLETVAGYTGQGVRAEVMDSGLDTSHVDWNNPPLLSTSTGAASHGTCTFGINFANGNSTPGGQTRGLLPDAQGIFANYNNYGNRYSHSAKLVDPVQQYRAVFQSNSWGGSRTTSYNSTSQEMDDIIFINDLSILQSQSNAGNQNSRPQAWAKNIISVGGIRHYNNTNDADDNWNFGASIGPAADGRIKPDIAAYYDSVWTSDNDPGGYASGDDYTGFNGTSAATPIVAGNLGLIYQMWASGEFGNPVGGGDVFDERPHNTTAKAILLNSSKQWSFAGSGHDLTRTHQGWGKPDLQRAYDNSDQTFVVDEDVPLGDMGSASWDVTVPAGAPEFRATLIYTDLAGTTSSNLHRINDLSLRVTSPGGLIYWGNNGLLSAMESTSGGSSNTKDTVEQVILANPASGTWKVDIFADEVNQDSHVETAGLDADFALVVTPVTASSGTDPINTMSLLGFQAPFSGIPTQYTFGNADPLGAVFLLASPNLGGTVFGGHDFDVGAPVSVASNSVADANGDGDFFITIPNQLSGLTYYLETASQSGGSWIESAPLQIDIQ